ncbi:MAG TPA: long-chain-acyl-CoA synthetase [Polyangiales bacterium]|nr:long-chain-acyl-CoA synthetase [Polyangiales bacterium]
MYYPLTHGIELLQGLTFFNYDSHETLAWQLQRRAATHPDDRFLLFEDESYSYAEANAAINRHVHGYRSLGIGKDDVVALLMDNRPEFLWHLFALHKLGAVASLINTNLQADPLVHAIRICQPRHVVASSEVFPQLANVRDRLDSKTTIEVDVDPRLKGSIVEAPAWGDRIQGVGVDDPAETGQHKLSDMAAFIYTSGTTGMPKAAIVRHHRMYRAGRVWAGLGFSFHDRQVLYNCLPMYHANAVILATGSVVTAGVTMALSRKFSRTRFWDEIRKHDARRFIYIGELCRYLLNNEPSSRDRKHRVRVISGNGLRPDIWRTFQKRFGLRRIVEFYGATEGNCITLNALGVTGSVGLQLRGMELVRWDTENNDFSRDARGHLVRTKTNEPGVLIGRIRRRAEFDGYQDKRASESKIIRNGFKDGDAWFDTGDLLRRDHLHHLHFVDRLGDTYRWKGENVATSEVQEQLSQWPAVREVSVYGVSVPGAEGRAGMAAMVLADGQPFDPIGLSRHVETHLPAYARPRFLRLMPKLGTTSTFKLKKSDLQNDGYDPSKLQDPLYVLDPKQGQYVSLTPALYDELSEGRMSL